MSPTVRISVTLDEEAVKWLDKQIENNRFRSRSHGIDVCVFHAKKTLDNGEPLKYK